VDSMLHTMRFPLSTEDTSKQIVLQYDPDQVYAPTAFSSILLVRNIKVNPDDVALELGTGSGIHPVGIAMRGARRVVTVDISETALKTATHNAELNEVRDRIEFRQGSMFDPVQPDEKFSLIVSSPPCLPDPGTTDPTLPGTTMLSGSDGSYHTVLLLDRAPHYLSPGGRVVFTYPSTSNPRKIFGILDRDYNYEIVAEIQTPFYLHFLEMWPYLEKLREQGLCDYFEIAGVPYRTYWLIQAQPKS
jgi:methylase of polypeptide subunit release factors